MVNKNKKYFNKISNKKKFSFFDNLKKKTKLEVKKQIFFRKLNIFYKKNRSLSPFAKNEYYKYSLQNHSFNKKSSFRQKKPKKMYFSKNSHRNRKSKRGIFFKKPRFKEISYPFYFNFKLLNEALVNK